MSELISGKEALIALANGKEVDYRVKNGTWVLVNNDWKIREFDQGHYEFRLKPRTVNLNGVDVPAPFEPKHMEKYWYISTKSGCSFGYDWACSCDNENDSIFKQFGAYRTEEEIKQVVAALRKVFK